MQQQIKYLIKLDFIIDIKNYRQSFNKWLKVRSKVLNLQSAQHSHQEISENQSFNKYLRVIKPVIHHFHQITTKLSEKQYGFYTDQLTSDQVKILKQVFNPLDRYELFSLQNAIGQAQKKPENVDILTQEQCQGLLEKKYEPIYRIQVLKEPKNDQLIWWGNGLDVDEVSFVSNVVKGKGEGRKSLGMPTANLQLEGEIQQKLIGYPNGVYLVNFEFVEQGKKYIGAACIGTNPHYQNFQQKRRVQVYVIHDFGESLFYGEKVKVTFRRLIRFQGKFHSFDSFLQAMHNDIQITRQSSVL